MTKGTELQSGVRSPSGAKELVACVGEELLLDHGEGLV